MTELAPLSRYDQAIALLAEVRSIHEALSIRDEAQKWAFVARLAKDGEAIANAVEIRLRAERQLGVFICAAKDEGQLGRGAGFHQKRTGQMSPAGTFRLRLSDAGIDRKLSSRAQKLAAHSPEQFQDMLTETRQRIVSGRAIVIDPVRDLSTVDKQQKRANREWSLAQKIIALPEQKFGVIYADPEWQFVTRSPRGMDRAADNHYPTSGLAALQARDVASVAAEDCVLLMWATSAMLIEAICVADAWGFALLGRDPQTGFLRPDKTCARYVSAWAWFKQKLSTGYWGRSQHEHLLIFTRGNPIPPAMGTQPGSAWHIDAVYSEPAGAHSAKPAAFADEIARLWPNTPKLELNARNRRAGWTVWGDEVADLDQSAPMADGVAGVELAVTSGAEVAAPLPFHSGPQADAIIADGYGAEPFDIAAIIARLRAELGMEATALQVRRRASRLGLGNRDRQRLAVTQANTRRGQGA